MSLLPNLEASVVEAAERHPLAVGDFDLPATDDVVQRQPARSRRRRWPLIAGTAGALAAAGIAAVLVVGIGSSGKLDVVAEARAALVPSGQILHLEVLVDPKTIAGGREIQERGQAALVQRVEQWSTDDPVRFRTKYHASRETSKFPGHPRTHLQSQIEIAWADRASTYYDADRGSMNTVTKLNPNSSASKLKALPGADESLGDLKGLLDRGRLADRGFATVAGKRVRRLTGKTDKDWGGAGTVTYDIDPQTFAPIRITVQMQRPNGRLPDGRMRPSRWTMIWTATIVKYERLPLTAQTEQLLRIHPPAGTKITSRTLGEARAEGRRARRAEVREAKERGARERARRP